MSDGWPAVRAALERARELPPEERAAFLDRELGADGAQRALVERLLAAEAVEDDFLEPPASRAPWAAALAEDDPAAWVGRAVGAYTLRRRLAEGGMGVVFEAEQRDLGRKVAVKLLRRGPSSPGALRRFREEARILARLEHPNIAQVLEAGVLPAGPETGGQETPWFALELVEGARTLHEHARAEGLGLRARLEFYLEVAGAVAHGHRRGIVHRDLKPANLLVGRSGRPKVIDFGIAKALDADPSAPGEGTLEGEVIGTIAYMSPEQVHGRREEVDTRADVYALGVVLYELLCDTPPFDLRGVSILSAGRVVTQEDPPPPSARAPGLAPELDWIVARAMEKDRERRYESVDALAEDLRRFLRHEPVAAGPPGRLYPVRKFVRRHRLAVGAAAVVALALLGGLVGTTLGMVRAVRAERHADRAREQAEDERAIAQAEADTASTVVDFLVDVLASADPSVDGPDVRVADVLGRAAERYGEAFAERPAVRTRVARALGAVYRGLGLRGESEEELERALAFLRDLHPGPHPETALVLGNLGTARLDAGRLEEAGALLAESAEMERALDPAGEGAHRAAVRLARLRLAQGRDAEAEELLRGAADALVELQGPGGRDALLALNVLAGVLHEARRYEEAEGYYRRALEGLRATEGDEHPDTLRLRLNLAMLAHSQGRVDEAIERLREVQAARERVLGPEHPDTLMTALNLGGVLQLAGRLEEAGEVYAGCVDRLRATHPDDHPLVQTVTVNLAQLERAAGRLDRAEELLREVFEARRRALGPSHAKTLALHAELVGIARERGELGLAEERARAALEAAEGTPAGADGYVALFLIELGRVGTLAGDYEGAERALLDAVAAFPEVPPGTMAEPEAFLAELYRAWERPERAAEWAARVRQR